MSENSATETIWLTQEAYDKLTKELDHLSGPGRAAVTAKIAAAREEGDLSENGGYHAAREEQAHQEARIRQLIDMLNRAQVGDAPVNADEVAPGTQVTIAFDGDESDTDTFLLGSRELLGLDDSVDSTNVYSPQSPLGSAILGKKTGDAVSYVAPNGRSINVTVVKVETARDMLRAVEAALPADAAIFAAAVADWRTTQNSTQKIKKKGGATPELALVENPDILATTAQRKSKRPALVVGFAAETQNVIENAKAKLARKGCDWIVANDVSAESGVMGGDMNTVHLVTAEGVESWPPQGKDAVAAALVTRIAAAFGGTAS